MQCEMCGSEKDLVKALIEGTELIVCSGCARFGKTLEKVDPEIKAKKRSSDDKQEREKRLQPEIIESVRDDFSRLLRKKRESLGLSQDDFAKKINEKSSFVHKIENNQMNPSLETARKLENLLNLKLIEKYAEESHSASKPSSEEVTIGDIIKVKKRTK